MNPQDIINKIIPADDLHWYEEEMEYKSVSKEQLDEIILACVTQGISEISDITRVVNWVTMVNVGSILIKNFLYGNIKITGFDENNDPYFEANNK
jgi:hypothetical protein